MTRSERPPSVRKVLRVGHRDIHIFKKKQQKKAKSSFSKKTKIRFGR